jgi:hypothetical protein
MRILFAIPHYYNPLGGGFYGSLRNDPKPRASALVTMVFGLYATFGARRGLLDAPARRIVRGTGPEAEIEVVICTNGPHHLLDKLPMLKGLVRQQPAKGDPTHLGFECHAVLRDALVEAVAAIGRGADAFEGVPFSLSLDER